MTPGGPDAAADLPSLPAPPGHRARRRGRPSWAVVLVALALAVVSLAVATVALVVQMAPGASGADLEAARGTALEAARDRTTVLTSYDHRTLEANVAAVLETATGQFERDYRSTSEQLRPTLLSEQAVAKATVVAVGLESASADRAVAVVAVDQQITTKGAAPRTERNRLRMTLVRPARTWLVERVQRL